jgi:hypothetical protein
LIIEGVKKITTTAAAVVSGGIKTGDRVYAKVNSIAAYTKPVADLLYLKVTFKIYDNIGIYLGASTVPNWSKVYMGGYGDLFIPTSGITNIKP